MPTNEAINDPRRPKVAPAEFAGMWVAWNRDQSAIIAHGSTMAAVIESATKLGAPDALLERVRRPDEALVGRL